MGEDLFAGNRVLIDTLDSAVREGSISEVTGRIADGLQGLVERGDVVLSDSLTRVLPGSYARRLLHRCPRAGYTVVVMTWGPGQGTQLHDHAGMWCVECVIEGELDVVQFELREQVESRCRFDELDTIRARVGDAGSLIPPFEYHVLRNALPDQRSVTLHVYAGEMDHCNLYLPCDGGWWTKTAQTLEYHG